MSKNLKFFFLLSLLTLIIFACSLPSNPQKTDPNIVFTAAAQTASVQLTEAVSKTVTQPPPSTQPTLLPSFTPAPTTESNCDKAKFVKDVTVPDGTVFSPGESFTKTWRVKNIGTCTWTTGYTLIFNGGSQMGGVSPTLLTGNVSPGETIDISVNLAAPATTGDYLGNWQIQNDSGELFAKIYVLIQVGTPCFAVTSVNLSVSGSCGHFVITAHITTNGAGEVTYKWKRSDGGIDTTNHPTLIYTSAGTQSVSTDWHLNAAGSHWMDIYIDAPNHQQFGRADFSCP